jgi:hypothetical protein
MQSELSFPTKPQKLGLLASEMDQPESGRKLTLYANYFKVMADPKLLLTKF